jgi:VIT1/CCC1 family predicted Fe2+/Mn2+ transporter
MQISHLRKKSLEENAEFEITELADIYEERGVEPKLAQQVAEPLMVHDALGAHARDEIGILESGNARPVQAALYSAGTFTIGAALPLVAAWAMPVHLLIPVVALSSLVFLALLGGIAARAGGASVTIGAIRVTFWGALAMALTAGVGLMFGVAA